MEEIQQVVLNNEDFEYRDGLCEHAILAWRVFSPRNQRLRLMSEQLFTSRNMSNKTLVEEFQPVSLGKNVFDLGGGRVLETKMLELSQFK